MGVSVRSMSSLKAHLDFDIYFHSGLLILTEKQDEDVLKLAYDRQVEPSNVTQGKALADAVVQQIVAKSDGAT